MLDQGVKQLRSVISFAVGLWGVIYETTHGIQRPYLLLLFAWMLGMPIAKELKNKLLSNILEDISEDPDPKKSP